MEPQDLLALEHQGWDALCAGTGADFYGDLMTDDGVMVLTPGFVLDREGVIASLDGAEPWQDYELTDARLVSLDADSAAVVYTATAQRGGVPPFRALMSSVYVRRQDRWRLALYQQTPIAAMTQ